MWSCKLLIIWFSELIQLGALSAKHAIRMEAWAVEVHTTYSTLKTDQLRMQVHVWAGDGEGGGAKSQLGALSAKHAIRMEAWAVEVHTTYSTLKTDQLRMQVWAWDGEWGGGGKSAGYPVC